MRCELPKKIAILGAGRSGLAAAKALLDKSISVFISDTCPPKKLDFILASNGLAHVPHEADMHTDKVLHYDALIVSPGIRFDEDILCRARKAHLPVLPELELGWCLSHAPFLAVTGSSGKSTTVCLLGEIFKAAHKEYVVSGNIGIPVSAVAPGKSEECTVIAETSSFQLEAIQRFHPHIAVILNVTKNHLDRHAGFDAYFSAKTTITRNMTNGDIIVLNGMDDNLCSWIQENPKKIHTVYFGKVPVNSDGIWIDNGTLLYRWNTTSGSIIRVDELSIAGLHNQANACAAAAAAKAAGIDDDAIAQGLARFRGLPHRLEFIAEHNGIAFYNDSKATTAESTACAVNAFPGKVLLIAGGKDKGCDFQSILPCIAGKIKLAVVIGEAANRIYQSWKTMQAVEKAERLDQAFSLCLGRAEPGDTVVLSPGCSSFDMFENYEHRGEEFKKLVYRFIDKNETSSVQGDTERISLEKIPKKGSSRSA